MLTVTTTPSAPTVERIVDGEVVEVLLDLAPLAETILRDMARALTGRHDSDLADIIVAELLMARASEWAHRSATACTQDRVLTTSTSGCASRHHCRNAGSM